MGIVERLTLEAAAADTMIACEHRHRYQLAAGLCAEMRVLDLCCGSGYGSAILAQRAEHVVGVDYDVATIELAAATVGQRVATASFEVADATAYLAGDLPGRFDAVVCFEGLEHLPDLGEALAALRRHAGRGLRVIASVPNSRLFREDNPFHLTDFGYDEARRAFAGFPALTMLPQFLAEGSLICPPDADGVDVVVDVQDRDEPESANHFIFCANVPAEAVNDVYHGHMQLVASPVWNRWSEGLKHGARALHRENARLARGLIGKVGAAAATSLAGLDAAPPGSAAVNVAVAGPSAASAPLPWSVGSAQVVVVAQPAPAILEIEADPNDLENRRRYARAYLVPWIEQAITLRDRTVLAYGAAAVSGAVAERCGQLIDAELDPDAVRSRTGTVDVVLLEGVLEHMSLPEQVDALRLAREVLAPGGAIVVCETPNRLHGFDGSGIGFHEFGAVFGDLSRHVLASSYDRLLHPVRPVRPEETALARDLDRRRPDLAPAWSRAILDVILARDPVAVRPLFIRPWTVDTTASRGVAWTRSETLRLSGPDATLAITLPHPTTRLAIAVLADQNATAEIAVSPRGGEVTLTASGGGPAGRSVWLELPLSAPAAEIDLRAPGAAEVVFVGYED